MMKKIMSKVVGGLGNAIYNLSDTKQIQEGRSKRYSDQIAKVKERRAQRATAPKFMQTSDGKMKMSR